MRGQLREMCIRDSTTRGLAAHTVVVSNEEAENFDLAIDTETAEPGSLGMTAEDGTALKAVSYTHRMSAGMSSWVAVE